MEAELRGEALDPEGPCGEDQQGRGGGEAAQLAAGPPTPEKVM